MRLAAVLWTSSAFAQTFEERLAARVAESRHPVVFKDGAFSGPGWDLLVQEGQASRSFLVGEEHGVAEPRVMFKFGASHMLRGRNVSEVFDLRPLRPLFSFERTRKSDPELMRIVHGFDAILVLAGSHPSQMLP